jgi:hypothetical protein
VCAQQRNQAATPEERVKEADLPPCHGERENALQHERGVPFVRRRVRTPARSQAATPEERDEGRCSAPMPSERNWRSAGDPGRDKPEESGG